MSHLLEFGLALGPLSADKQKKIIKHESNCEFKRWPELFTAKAMVENKDFKWLDQFLCLYKKGEIEVGN